jgi:tryptophan synthase alpha chain
MSRIKATFAALKAQNRKALIPFVTAGFPYADITPELMHGMVDAGADVIELGVPFSDPSADGPVIQKAGDKALAFGVGLVQVLVMVRDFRTKNKTTPVVLMGYANPIERYDQLHASASGNNAFARDAAAAGVDGVLVVDYPPEECVAFAAALKVHALDLIFLLAPTSTEARMQQIAALASGYVYYGRRHAGHRRSRSHAAAHPPACPHPSGCGIWHPRCGHRPRHWPGGRCRGDWKQDHPAH